MHGIIELKLLNNKPVGVRILGLSIDTTLVSIDDSRGISIDDSRGISIDTLISLSIDYYIEISIDECLVKLYARVELCSLGFLDQLSSYSNNSSSVRTDSG